MSIRRLLFNPGPTNVADEVRAALLTPDLSHRDPQFRACLADVRERLVRLLGGAGTHEAVMFASSGTGANEAIISSIRGRMLVLENGRYSERLRLIAERFGVPVVSLPFGPYEPIEIDRVEAAVADGGFTHLAVVHHETTTGMLAPLSDLGRLAGRHGVRLVVDAISSAGGAHLDLREDNVAFCSLNPNKCLEGLPGISFAVVRREELAEVQGASRSFYFDLHEQWRRQARAEMPFTAPVQVTFAFEAALRRLEAEGVEQRIARYRRHAEHLRAGLRGLGLRLVEMPEEQRSDIVVPVHAPPGLDFPALHRRLLERDITIYSAKGCLAEGRFFVAAMGAIDLEDVDRFLLELRRGLEAQDLLPAQTRAQAVV